MSWKSLRGAAQRAQPTGGRSPSVEPLDSCLLVPTRPTRGVYPLCSFTFCVCGGFILLCAPRPVCLGAAPRRPSCCLTSSFSYSLGWCFGGRLCSSSGSTRRKSESQVGIHPVLPSPPSDVCARAARRTLAAYLSSAVCGAVLASPRSATIMNSLGPLGRVMEVSQRCRPAGPTHGRSISLC